MLLLLLLLLFVGVKKGRIALIMHIHLDYVKIVVELICTNDKLTLTVLKNSGLNPWLVLQHLP